jgi:hypothetical protein
MGTYDTHGGSPISDKAFEAPDFFTAESALAEAKRLGLKVTFGPDEVSESGGLGIAYAEHGGDASKAFIALIEAAGEG